MIDLLNDLTSRAMGSVAEGNIAALGALFFVSALTEVGVPFPFILDSVLVISGYQTGLVSFEVARIMFALLGGRVVGSAAIYWAARFLGGPFLNWAEKRFPLLRSRLTLLTSKLSRRAPLAVAIARLTPGLLTPSSVASGFMRLRYYHFVLGIGLSSVIADIAIIILGFVTRETVQYFGFAPALWHVFLALVIMMAAIWAVRHFLLRSY